MWRSENNHEEGQFSSTMWVLGIELKLYIRLGGKLLYLLSHLTEPKYVNVLCHFMFIQAMHLKEVVTNPEPVIYDSRIVQALLAYLMP